MKKKQQDRFSSLNNWNNDMTSLRPTSLARVFAAGNLPPELLAHGDAVLRIFSEDPKEAKKLASLIPRSEFRSAQSYFAWCQFLALFIKSADGGSEKARELAALKSFSDSERSCYRANRRLRHFEKYPNRLDPVTRTVMARARCIISRVLGEFTPDVLDYIIGESRPGSGVCIGTRDRLRVTAPFKLADTRLCCSERALPYARQLVEGSPVWLRLVAEVDWERGIVHVPYVDTPYNRVSFVAKDSTTMRTIAVEPHLNVCLQLGVHAYLARQLRRVGVDLHDQTGNQRMAREGAARWADADPLVTLDLSAASDSLSIGLVESLLPPTWVDFLGCLRSDSYMVKGKGPYRYQKWSSMGNGYTFALESLVFAALAQACLTLTRSQGRVAVYGDDIIVPRGSAALLIQVLKYCGFRVNTDKSSLFGEFRESCGEDYWATSRVVPVYLRGLSRLRPTDMYRLVNGLSPQFVNGGIRQLCYDAHVGRPILYGLESLHNEASCWWTDFASLRERKLIRYVPRHYAWVQRVAIFRPRKVPVDVNWGYAAALFGTTFVSDDRFAAKSTLRREGKWSLTKETVDAR